MKSEKGKTMLKQKISLLVSAVNLKEAITCYEAGVDIIDIKNPGEGSLGANFPWVIKEIVDNLKNREKPEKKSKTYAMPEISATIGDLDFIPGSASLAAFALAKTGVDYIKAGIKVSELKKAEKLCVAIKRACEHGNSESLKKREKKHAKLVLAAYADFYEIKSISPMKLIEIAEKVKAAGIMIDTYNKACKKTLFDFLDEEYIKKFVEEAKNRNLIVALAGKLDFNAIERIKKFENENMPHIIGIRSLACSNGERGKDIEKGKIAEIKRFVERIP